MQRLTKRRDFVAARDGRKAHAATLTLQSRRREADEAPPEPRAGFTVTKKTGGAVERNRIRRRLRAALAQVAATTGTGAAQDGHDYVVIGREPALSVPFATLLNDLSHAFARVHGPKVRRDTVRRDQGRRDGPQGAKEGPEARR